MNCGLTGAVTVFILGRSVKAALIGDWDLGSWLRSGMLDLELELGAS